MTRAPLLRLAAFLLPAVLLACAWKWTGLRDWTDAERLVEGLEPYRRSWLAGPVVVLVFVAAELLLFPVLVLVFACGLVFGPWLGSVYALAGSISSAVVAFLLGRRLGRARLESVFGALAERAERLLERRGVVAVFLVRKIPAPFTIVNLLCGASPVSLRDFVLGTLIGMGTGTLLLTILGSRMIEILRRPGLEEIALGALLLFAPLAVAMLVQRRINRRLEPGR